MSNGTMTNLSVSFDLTEEKIAELSEKYYDLKINGPNDKEGLATVHAGRMDIKAYKVAVEKRRKKLNGPLIATKKLIDAEAKRLQLLLLPVYQRLEEMEFEVVREQERIARVAAEEKQAELKRRIAAMASVEWIAPVDSVEAMSDDEFCKAYELAKKGYETKREAAQREADEMQAKKAELERREREVEVREAKLPPPEALAASVATDSAAFSSKLHGPESTRTTNRERISEYAHAIAAVPLPMVNHPPLLVQVAEIVSTCTDALRALPEE